MTKLDFSYIIVEDELEVCKQVKNRMEVFSKWACVGIFEFYDDALHSILNDRPNLLFLDYSIRGGNSFFLIDEINKIEDYFPYIIFFTGFQSDNPEIPEYAINRHRVNKYLVKPIFEKLSQHLHEYVQEAEQWVQERIETPIWIETIDKKTIKLLPDSIICISQSKSNSRNKILYIENHESIEIKSGWEECVNMVSKPNLQFVYANQREALINVKYISKKQKPFIWLHNQLKVEVTKEKWKEFF